MRGIKVTRSTNSSACRQQFVGHHRRLGGNRRHDRNPYAFALHRLHQRPEVAVAGEKHHAVDVIGHLHRGDREFDIHISLTLRRPVSRRTLSVS